MTKKIKLLFIPSGNSIHDVYILLVFFLSLRFLSLDFHFIVIIIFVFFTSIIRPSARPEKFIRFDLNDFHLLKQWWNLCVN